MDGPTGPVDSTLPGVSIIVAAYKAQDHIGACVASLLAQDYPAALEILIGVDGCPDTLQALRQLRLPDNVHVHVFPDNHGPFAVFNSLVALARYPGLLFFGADDLAFPNMVGAALAARAGKHDIVSMVSHDRLACRGAMFITRSAWDMLGGYEPWRCAADWELQIRAQRNGLTMVDSGVQVFARHIGNRTLSGAADTGMTSELREAYHKEGLESTKFKIEPATAECRPMGDSLPEVPLRAPTLGVSMIVRDESSCLDKCLTSVAGVDELVVVDSVAAHCPVIIRYRGLTRIVTLEELFDFVKSPIRRTNRGEEIKHCKDLGIETWHRMHGCKNGQSWTKLNAVIRHAYKGKIIRVNTVDGLIDVTPNHSLFSLNGRTISADQLVVGNKVLEGELRQCHDTGKVHANKFFLGTPELAWCWGVFAAEGSAFKIGKYCKVKWSNKDASLLERCSDAIRIGMNVTPQKITNPEANGMRALLCYGEKLFMFFRERFYDGRGEKRVPCEILNAPEHIRQAFLDGYMAGDGHWSDGKYPSYTSKSWLLSQGVLWLWNSLGYNHWSLYIREDKPNIVQINLNITENRRRDPTEIKKIWSMDYDGLVYDLSTDDGRFQAGVGTVFAHNTGSKDNTQEIARKYTDKVFTAPWDDDYAAARNISMAHCTTDFVLSIDADEELEAGGIEKIRRIIAEAPANHLAYGITMVATKSPAHVHHLVRLWRNHLGLHWNYVGHEVLSRVKDLDLPVTITYGYSAAHRGDPDRMLRILQKGLVKQPDCPRYLFYISREYACRKDYPKAIELYEKYLTLGKFAGEVAEAHLQVAKCYAALKDWKHAKEHTIGALATNAEFKEALLFASWLFGPKNGAAWKRYASTATNADVMFRRC